MDLHDIAEQVNDTKRANKFQVTEWVKTDDIYLLSELMYQVHGLCQIAESYRNKYLVGFKEPSERGSRTIPEALMLIVTELGEATEAFINGDKENFKEEFADTIIRILDTAADLGFHKELEGIIAKKNNKNKERGFRHGGKTA